jgi:membrane-associated protease RseP (regulator of RpoE activity)
MADETPLEPIEPEPMTAETAPVDPAPTEPVATTTTAPGQAAWPTPAPPAKASSSTVAVPKWLLLVAGAVVIALIGFGIGYAVAPDDGGGRDVRAFGPGQRFTPGPFQNNGGQSNGGQNNGGQSNGANGNGGSNDQPTIPTPSSDSAFLGVATTASTNPAGVEIRRVIATSPAADAGLKVGDVITKVDNDAVTNPDALGRVITGHERGDEVTITYVRSGKTDTTRVTLVDRASADIPTPTPSQPRL